MPKFRHRPDRTGFHEEHVVEHAIKVDCVLWSCAVEGCDLTAPPTVSVISPVNTSSPSFHKHALALKLDAEISDVNLHLQVTPPYGWSADFGGLCPLHDRQYRRIVYTFLSGDRNDAAGTIEQHVTKIVGLPVEEK